VYQKHEVDAPAPEPQPLDPVAETKPEPPPARKKQAAPLSAPEPMLAETKPEPSATRKKQAAPPPAPEPIDSKAVTAVEVDTAPQQTADDLSAVRKKQAAKHQAAKQERQQTTDTPRQPMKKKQALPAKRPRQPSQESAELAAGAALLEETEEADVPMVEEEAQEQEPEKEAPPAPRRPPQTWTPPKETPPPPAPPQPSQTWTPPKPAFAKKTAGAAKWELNVNWTKVLIYGGPALILMAGMYFFFLRGPSRQTTYAAEGVVLYQGKPAEGARVTLFPLDKKKARYFPTAKVGSDGTFKLTTYETDDGAPAGKYMVAIVRGQIEMEEYADLSKKHTPEEVRRIQEKMAQDPLYKRYSNPTDSGLTAEITSSSSNRLKFELE